MSSLLRNKVSIVTGGASGIGYAVSELFVKSGANVVIVDINKDEGNKAVALIKKHAKSEGEYIFGECIFNYADVTNEDDVKKVVDDVIKIYGKIDVLVNNAGIYFESQLKPIWDVKVDEFDKMISVNLKGAFLFIKYVAPIMAKHRQGVIINVTSELTGRGLPYRHIYAASKGGLLSLTKSLAVELAQYNIRVNAISPGPTLTPLHERRFQSLGKEGEQARAEFLKAERVPLRRVASPEEIARVILFIASDWANYITGAEIAVDGGTTCKL
jgi:NAD(P)-dependent dehydrogenase (short-subunit alcohol dehydrogenase family)